MSTATADLDSLVENGPPKIVAELLAKPHMKLGDLLLRYQCEFRAMGLQNPRAQLLGKGSFGVAYEININGEPSVLKLTRDPYEVLSSASLQGEESQRIVKIYRVWGCEQSVPKGDRGKRWLGWFVIHRDILRPIGKNDAKMLEFLYARYMNEDMDLWIPKAGPSGRAMREKWKMNIQGDLSPHELPRAMQLLDEVSLGVKEMNKHGIDWADMHSDNMMRDRKGVLRIADVGFGIPKRDFKVTPPEFSMNDIVPYLAALEVIRV